MKDFESGTRKLVVSGSPGIGKSWFGFFLLHHIAKTDPDAQVVWQFTRREETRLLFSRNCVARGVVGSTYAFQNELEDPRTWCVHAARVRTTGGD